MGISFADYYEAYHLMAFPMVLATNKAVLFKLCKWYLNIFVWAITSSARKTGGLQKTFAKNGNYYF